MAFLNRLLPLLLIATPACVLAAPAQAQSTELAELDDLVDISVDPQSALALARDQIGESDLTGAVATLERVLIAHPESNDALLLHVALLCRLDERDDARLELDELARIGLSPSAEVTQSCGTLPPRER